MVDIYDEKMEQVMTSKLHEHEAARLAAERKLATARNEMIEAEQATEHWRFALQDYRKSHGLPPQPPNPSPILEAEYSHMGPTELVEYWANKHDGNVVVKDLTDVAVNAGVFSDKRHGVSMIYTVVKRKGFKKVGPGHFKRTQTSMQTQEVDGKNIPLPVVSSEPIIVSVPELGTGE